LSDVIVRGESRGCPTLLSEEKVEVVRYYCHARLESAKVVVLVKVEVVRHYCHARLESAKVVVLVTLLFIVCLYAKFVCLVGVLGKLVCLRIISSI
jgi:hypothetical protein